MTERQNQFLALWQECYNAAYYALRTSKVGGFLHDAATLAEAIHHQVWDERFGNAMVRHPACRFLDELQDESLEVSIHVRSRLKSFKPQVGAKLSLLAVLIPATLLLILLLIFLPKLLLLPKLLVLAKYKLHLTILLAVLLAGSVLAGGWVVMQSLRAPQQLKEAFEQEKNAILKLLEAVR